ncbi:MAG: tRNA pseudouridine(55) synthase TruB [Caldicoprobacterales bacterium]|jgi:tRNA pseudouridine55 synthase
MDGVINVLKPPGMTSSDVVVYLRRLLKVKKIGHAGTLDPGAAGVLVVCVGRATKIAEYMMEADKAYRGGLVLGVETDTLDADGNITNVTTYLPELSHIEEVFQKYQGRILQTPPMYSAIKHKGKPLYKLARQCQSVEVAPREVEIFENTLLEFYPPNEVYFQVSCSKGTYIRSLVRDIGKSLGCGAYLSHLIRLASGQFNIAESVSLQEISGALLESKIEKYVTPMDIALSGFSSVTIADNAYARVINGNLIRKESIISGLGCIAEGELLRIYCRKRFIGLGYIDSDNMIRMRKVLG